MRGLHFILRYATGEFLLEDNANGGTVVFVRSVMTSAVIYTTAVLAKGLLTTGMGSSIDWPVIRQIMLDTLPWAGAILGGTYAAFYARFASQWTYLAGLYNQLMETQAQAPRDGNEERERVYANWKAGIVEDAVVLHLAAKPMFAPLIAALLKDIDVVMAFRESAVDSERALTRLEKALSRTLRKNVTAAKLPPPSE
jgi:hypothetical protein